MKDKNVKEHLIDRILILAINLPKWANIYIVTVHNFLFIICLKNNMKVLMYVNKNICINYNK